MRFVNARSCRFAVRFTRFRRCFCAAAVVLAGGVQRLCPAVQPRPAFHNGSPPATTWPSRNAQPGAKANRKWPRCLPVALTSGEPRGLRSPRRRRARPLERFYSTGTSAQADAPRPRARPEREQTAAPATLNLEFRPHTHLSRRSRRRGRACRGPDKSKRLATRAACREQHLDDGAIAGLKDEAFVSPPIKWNLALVERRVARCRTHATRHTSKQLQSGRSTSTSTAPRCSS